MALARVKGMVSVVVPVHNRKRYVVECLESLRTQTYRNIEIIIVDDASTDGATQVVRGWVKKNSGAGQAKVRLVLLSRNVGYAGALTTGMYLARGEFIAIQDADDYSHRERMRRQAEFLQSRKSVGMVGSSYSLVRSGKVLQQGPGWLRYGWNNIKRAYKAGGHCVSLGTVMFRGQIFDRLGGLRRRLEGAEDYDFIANCIKHGVLVENLRAPLYYYRLHRSQRSRLYYPRSIS